MNAGVLEAEGIHLGPDAADDDAIQKQIGRRVVADRGHEPRRVVDGEHRPVVKELNDPRAGHLIDLEHSQRIVERELALRHEIVHRHQNRDLDQAGGGKGLVSTPVDARASLEVDDAVSDHAVMRVGDRIESATQRGGVSVNDRQSARLRMARPRRSAGNRAGKKDRDIAGGNVERSGIVHSKT